MDAADVDAHFKGRGSDGRRGPGVVFQGGFGIFAKLPGQVPVMGQELVRHARCLAQVTQPRGEQFNGPAGISENEVVLSAQCLVQVGRDLQETGLLVVFLACPRRAFQVAADLHG
jgi:hypothetical protein